MPPLFSLSLRRFRLFLLSASSFSFHTSEISRPASISQLSQHFLLFSHASFSQQITFSFHCFQLSYAAFFLLRHWRPFIDISFSYFHFLFLHFLSLLHFITTFRWLPAFYWLASSIHCHSFRH
jgi:hypothetical protein